MLKAQVHCIQSTDSGGPSTKYAPGSTLRTIIVPFLSMQSATAKCLILSHDPVRILDLHTHESLDPGITVIARTRSVTHLNQPRPDLVRPRLDRNRARTDARR